MRTPLTLRKCKLSLRARLIATVSAVKVVPLVLLALLTSSTSRSPSAW
jgi:hypothetical protein